MHTNEAPGGINHDRRRFLGTAGAAALAVGATQLGMIGSARAQTKSAVLAAATATSFGPVKQINAGLLNVEYVEAGPADGRPVTLLHGFPYDIHSFVEVAPLLAAQGYRVIVPYMRRRGRLTSSRRSGRSAVRRWSQRWAT
jgi:hypothetical protein